MGDKAVLISIFGGVLFYAALYPQPYLNDRPVDQPIAVVDQDNTATSRQLARWADSTQDVSIVRTVSSITDARRLLIDGNIRGMMVIPNGFERDLILGRSPTVAIAADASYFLVYGTVIEGLVGAITGVGATHKISRMLLAGSSVSMAREQWMPIQINERPLFNVNMGYLEYVIPAVFIMILQQTALLAGGLLGAARKESGEEQPDSQLLARFTLLFFIYFLLTLFYVGVCFKFYGIVRVAGIQELLILIGAYVAAIVAMAVFLGTLFKRRELAAPVVMASSLPLVFCAGFVWPLESLPHIIRGISLFFPTTSGIQGFLKLNQMGADFEQIYSHFLVLLLLCVGYLTAALIINSKR